MDRKAIFKNNFESSFTWIEGFMRNVRRYGDQTALSCPPGGLKYSYRELNSEVNRLACALQDKGVRKGDVVMYMLHNSVQFVLCYIAPQKLGAVNCPVNYYLSAGELALNIEDSRPKVFVYESNFADVVEAALKLSSFRPEVILATGGATPEGHTDFNDFLNKGSDREPVPDEPLNIYDECTRLYTSGTTSRPKGVPLYSINEVLSAHDVIMHFPMTHGDKTMNMTPWFHRGGLHSGGPCPTLYVGGEVVVMREFNAGLTLQYTQDYGINFLIGVPAVLNLLSTETFWNTFLRPADLPEHAGSCGRACTDDDVRVVKVHPDRFAEPDETVKKDNAEIGEVIIASPAKSGMHYMGNDELTGQRFHNGFFYTGDLAVWDKDSYVTIVTRKDDMIVSSGENIYPAQVESVLMEHPDVVEACVVGLPDKLRDQVTVAYVVPKDSSLTVKDLIHFVNNHQMLAAYKRPKFYRICDSLPHTPTGKLQRAVVREQVLQDFEMGLLHR